MKRTVVLALLTTSFAMLVVSAFLFGPSDWLPSLVIGSWLTSMGAFGALVILRRPGNVLGILMLTIGVGGSLSLLATSYAEYVFEQGHPSLVGGEFAAWLSLWTTIPSIGLFLLVFLRFPDGRLLSPRWRLIESPVIAGIVLAALSIATRPGPVDNVPSVDNPFGVTAFGEVRSFVEQVGNIFIVVGLVAAIVSLVLRFRRAQGIERQQVRTLALAVTAFPPLFAVAVLVGELEPGEEDLLSFIVAMTAVFLIPISLGISILRYRLYDIDVFVNRALVYGSLTALIAGFYLGVVVALQLLLEPITDESDLAVAASTLAAAAVVRPLRSRVQGFIDRRFYRRKYDSARALDSLAKRLRDEVDLSVVGQDVTGVVHETLQPAHVTLWVRQGTTS